ncbi:hypothetical protein FQA39_LY03786 [Lamprigera yunnana]|nr:hypothetical protein FQA39_LY03786 [Lamprigera yunnana]
MTEATVNGSNGSTVCITSDNDPKKQEKNLKMILPQIVAVMIKNIFVLPIGMNIGFIPILIPQLVINSQEPFEVNDEEVSWISSITFLTSCVGSVVSGILSHSYGRRRVMTIITIPFFISWLIHYFSNKVWHIFFALAGNGICCGLTGAAAFSYVAEITQPHVRGMLAATSTLTIVTGILLEFFIGTFLSWRTAALVSSGVPVVAFCLMWFLPESPHWLLSKDRTEEARKSLAWFRGWGSTDSVETEFQKMYNDYKATQNNTKDVEKLKAIQVLKEKCRHLMTKSFFFPLILVSYLYILACFTGGYTSQTYSVLIFSTLNVPIDKYYANLLMGVVELLGCVLSIIFVKYFGKRKMGMGSLIGLIICNIFIGVYTCIQNIKLLEVHDLSPEDIEGHTWIPLILLLSLAFSAHCGVKTLPWILVGEVFSFETRGLGVGLCIGMSSCAIFLTNKVFLQMIWSLTFYGVYWFYACFGVIGLIVIYLTVPETEGRTLQEITDHFAGRQRIKNKLRRSIKVHPAADSTFTNENNLKV